jgi:AP-1-like factor
LPLFPQAKTLNNRANEQEFDFNGNFDEGISEFCTDLNTACGTKDCPVPKSKSQAATPVEPKKDLADSKTHDDALYFLNDNTNLLTGYSTFDPSLAFDNGLSNNFNNNLFDDEPQINESDPLASLTTEESVYDPFGLFTQLETSKDSPAGELNSPSVATLKTPNSVAAPSTGIIAEDDFNEIVPAKEQKYMKCTEIWDRITAHPKYSDIDIDGLCNELRAKAKCSDKGVVIDFHDVNNVIEKSLK